ncbi:hypothetical protein [Salinimicrobium sp. 3283s]|uniref:hypothetical protein n=1 Tax=unclassified Salinimicrobium TaxID=2643747 RepID=UPI0031EFFE0E
MRVHVFIKMILSCFLLSMSSGVLAQTYINEEEVDQKVLEANLNGLIGGISITQPNFSTVQGNAVALKQIGEYNQAEIRTQTTSSEITLTQNGRYNYTKLDYIANTAIAKLLQEGDNNQIRDYVNDAGTNISLELEQRGDDKVFERNGANDLTQSLKFIQTDATPSLIIRSYN